MEENDHGRSLFRRTASRRSGTTPIARGVVAIAVVAGVLTPAVAQENSSETVPSMTDEFDLEAVSRAGTRYYNSIPSYDPHPFDRTHVADGLLFPTEYWELKNRVWREKRLAVGGYYSTNLQSGDQDERLHGVSEFICLITWEAVRRPDQKGRFVTGFAHDVTLGPVTTRNFSDLQGLVETPNDLDTDPDGSFITHALALWEHEFFLDGPEVGWGFRIGQLFAAQYFALAEYLNDDRRFFMARPLASAAAVQWVGNNDIGLGGQLAYWHEPFWISGAIMDGNGSQQYPDFKQLFDGKGLLLLGEIGLEHDLGGPNETALRVTVSQLERTDEGPEGLPGQAMAVSAYKMFDGEWGLFGRWSKSFNRLTADYRELVSFGAGTISPFGWEQDFLAVGAWFGDPSDATKGTESGIEISYRFQLTQSVRITPDFQYWHRRDPGSTANRAVIWGVRATMEF